MKSYYITPQIGRARHCVSYHDGQKKHKDGSPFFDLAICKNIRRLARFVRGLKAQGYVETL